MRILRANVRLGWAAAFLAATALVAASLVARADGVRALVVGGGPDPEHNQVAIESNVRYVLRLLPRNASRTVLFADGDRKSENVLYEERAKDLKPAERILALILDGRTAAHPEALKYRATSIPQIDGPSKTTSVSAAFGRLAQQSASRNPLLLYFTGHGSPAKDRNLNNNVYDLWGDGTLSVRELAAHISRLPADQPVTLVMVQCFSGAFGNLLFENGDPEGPAVDRDIAGFFATVKERVAAGCTPAVDESEYHDFTSYFFAALTGRDRVGRPVDGADFYGDRRITMDEAFCYALIHDASIDIPVCTSDVFLRTVVKTTPDSEVFKSSYADVRSWATPPQRAALDALSKQLTLDGDDRGAVAYARFIGADSSAQRTQTESSDSSTARRAWRRAQSAARRELVDRFPDVRDSNSARYAAERKDALDYVDRHIDDPRYRTLMKADDDMDSAEDAQYRGELAEAQQVRFVRLFKTVALTHLVRASGDTPVRQRLERLLASERRPLFAPSAIASR